MKYVIFHMYFISVFITFINVGDRRSVEEIKKVIKMNQNSTNEYEIWNLELRYFITCTYLKHGNTIGCR